MIELDKLKSHVLEGGYDEDSKKQVADLEAELQHLLMAERLTQNPVIAQFISYLKMQSDNCTYLLSNNRTLTELERLNLFDKRELCDHFTQMFTGEQKESIENSIKELLNVAQT